MAVFLVTLALLLLVAVGGRFIGYLQEAAMGKFTGTTVLTIIGLRLPEFLQLVAPFALYVALLLTLGRMYAEQEMVVLQTAGLSTVRLLVWVSGSVVIIVGLVAALAWVLTPLSQRVLLDFVTQQRAQSEFETVNPGVFHTYDYGRRVTYSQDISADRRVLYDVFISQRLETGATVNIWAQSATQAVDERSGSRFLILNDGRRYEFSIDSMDVRSMAFKQLSQRLETVDKRRARLDVEAAPMQSLGSDPLSRAEWHWRVALPLFTLIGAVLAVGISRVQPRQGRFARVLPGMLVMLVYYLALVVNQNALREEDVPADVGLWGVHLSFAILAVVL
ncbi:MAG: LPS export ABC transporter permease LptF, partial [Gammaproteobacteria bacterium]|nr:LPS export ABC transporter permease LptF [Gammaproteobacteria bacterium]